MTRLQRLREYARNLRESIRKLINVVTEIVSNFSQFIGNIVKIVITTIHRAIKLIWEDAINFVKGAIRLIVDVSRWPLEHIILPITRWLVDKSDKLYALVDTRDEIAIGLFLLMTVLSCVCGCSLVAAVFGLGW